MTRMMLIMIILASCATAVRSAEPSQRNPPLGAMNPPPQPIGPIWPANEPLKLGGKVLAVGKDSITIQSFGLMHCVGIRGNTLINGATTEIGNPHITIYTHYTRTASKLASGITVLKMTRDTITMTMASGRTRTIHRSDLRPRNYKVSAILASGKTKPWAGDKHAYRLSDVRIGDDVELGIRDDGDVFECITISIDRRPGGRVPPSQAPNADKPWHEWANAQQDLEEKGIPLPAKFQPGRMPTIPKLSPADSPLVPAVIPPARD